MNKRIKEEWVKALESSEYPFGKGQLRDNTKDDLTCFCAFGVLCDLYAKEKKIEWDNDYHFINDVAMEGPVPLKVLLWAEIGPSINSRIVALNDRNNSFELVTKYIKEEL